MRCVCLMMEKNEDVLLEMWIRHHADLFGNENLYIFDNGSTNPETLRVLRKHQKSGVNVDFSFSRKEDFPAKGQIIQRKITELSQSKSGDFFFPLDCDELLSVTDDAGNTSFSLSEIEKELSSYFTSAKVLRINSGMDNFPYHKNLFRRSPDQRKCFFSASAKVSFLDMGFHEGRTEEGADFERTNIVYFHFHFRPHAELVSAATEKLTGRVESFERQALIDYKESRKAGFHLVGHLLNSEEEYKRSSLPTNAIDVPQVADRLYDIGLGWPYIDLFNVGDAFGDNPITVKEITQNGDVVWYDDGEPSDQIQYLLSGQFHELVDGLEKS